MRDDFQHVRQSLPDVADVHQHNHRAINFIFRGAIRPDAQRIPMAFAILDLDFFHVQAVNHFGHQIVQIGKGDVRIDISDAATNIAGDKVENLLRQRSEPPDGEVIAEHHNRHIETAEQVAEVVVGLAQIGVPVLQFLVERRQFLVGGLQFLLGRFQLFVRALQFLVGRLNFLVGRLQLLIRRFLFLDDGLQRFLRLAKLQAQMLGLAFSQFLAGRDG